MGRRQEGPLLYAWDCPRGRRSITSNPGQAPSRTVPAPGTVPAQRGLSPPARALARTRRTARMLSAPDRCPRRTAPEPTARWATADPAGPRRRRDSCSSANRAAAHIGLRAQGSGRCIDATPRQMAVALDLVGTEAAFEDMARPAVDAVEPLRVRRRDPAHCARQIDLLRVYEQVDVVRHQAIPVAVDIVGRKMVLEQAEDPLAVAYSPKKLLSRIASEPDVAQAVDRLAARLAWHPLTVRRSGRRNGRRAPSDTASVRSGDRPLRGQSPGQSAQPAAGPRSVAPPPGVT